MKFLKFARHPEGRHRTYKHAELTSKANRFPFVCPLKSKYNLAMATALLRRINTEIDLVLLYVLFQTAQITIAIEWKCPLCQEQ